METKEALLERFGSWADEVRKLSVAPEDVWSKPATAAWTVKDVVVHVMAWDRYFYEEAVRGVAVGGPITAKHLDYDVFNAASVAQGRELSIEEVVRETIAIRERILETLKGVPEAMYDERWPDGDGNSFAIRQYLKDFIWHDEHHLKQIFEATV
ncbi:DinB family protein [Paenibacillus sp. TRM 82003]|nr:DinB family protein [Paenibacillus sp. TRM 82003]